MLSDRVTERFRGNELFLMPRSRVPHIRGSFIVSRAAHEFLRMPVLIAGTRRCAWKARLLEEEWSSFAQRPCELRHYILWGFFARCALLHINFFLARCGASVADHFSFRIRYERDLQNSATTSGHIHAWMLMLFNEFFLSIECAVPWMYSSQSSTRVLLLRLFIARSRERERERLMIQINKINLHKNYKLRQ